MIALNIFGIEVEIIFLVYAVVIFVLFFGLRVILHSIRKRTDRELIELLYVKEQYVLYQELLKNKRLRLIFSKIDIEILKLNGFMVESNDEKIMNQITYIDQLKLNNRQKIDFLSKRFTYFVELGNQNEASLSYVSMKEILERSKKNEASVILDEAKTVLNIYIYKDIRLIPSLLSKAENETNTVVQGVLYYRIAKLYYFAEKPELSREFLFKSQKQLKGTYYEDIIEQALIDLNILNTK